MSDRVQFGLLALSVAMKAKCNAACASDYNALAVSALRLSILDTLVAQEAVAEFLSLVDRDAPQAGAALQAFITKWIGPAELEGAPQRHDWQDRKDTGDD